jgi:hypothetical protein
MHRDALSPVTLEIRNLGQFQRHLGSQAESGYSQLSSAPQLAPVPLPLTESQKSKAYASATSQQDTTAAGDRDRPTADWQHAEQPPKSKAGTSTATKAVNFALQQTSAVESLYQQLLQDMDKAARQTNTACLALRNGQTNVLT